MVGMRRLRELPRMDYDTKAGILGVAASGAVKNEAAQKDVNENGHPFSWCEAKPIQFFASLFDHLGITHIVDLTAGSGALAIAAAGAGLKYEGVAGTDAHKDWLDAILDRVVFYLRGTSKACRAALGADESVADNIKDFFAPIIMEAKQILESANNEGAEEEGKVAMDDDVDDSEE